MFFINHFLSFLFSFLKSFIWWFRINWNIFAKTAFRIWGKQCHRSCPKGDTWAKVFSVFICCQNSATLFLFIFPNPAYLINIIKIFKYLRWWAENRTLKNSRLFFYWKQETVILFSFGIRFVSLVYIFPWSVFWSFISKRVVL